MEQAFDQLDRDDWLEAFAGHPRIGDLDSLRHRFAATAALAAAEQAGTREASDRVLRALAQGNADYERRFGHLFIVCATGKSADEMLAILDQRLSNDPDVELEIAAGEQRKITRLRLACDGMSPITTHVLDLACGRPAAGVAVTLERARPDGTWIELGAATTDANGRAGDLVASAASKRASTASSSPPAPTSPRSRWRRFTPASR